MTACLSQVLSDIWSLSVIINNDIVIIIYHHHQNHHHQHQLDKTIWVARVTTVVSHSAIIILRWRWGRSLILLQRWIRQLDASQLRRSKDARRCFSGSENDWKRMIRSLENPGVYENPCGDLMLPALAHSLCVDIILSVWSYKITFSYYEREICQHRQLKVRPGPMKSFLSWPHGHHQF